MMANRMAPLVDCDGMKTTLPVIYCINFIYLQATWMHDPDAGFRCL